MHEHSEEALRDELRKVCEDLIELSSNDKVEIKNVISYVDTPSCENCGNYSDDVTVDLKVKYKR